MGETTRRKTKASANDVAADQGTVNGAGPEQDELNKTAAAATERREKAEAARAAAEQALAAARDHQAALERALETGGADVGQAEFDRAVFETRKAAGTLSMANRELAEAKQAEQVAVAIAAASTLLAGQASREALDAAVADAQRAVTKAVQKVIDVAGARNTALAQAMAKARTANLSAGAADPFSPVLIGSKPHSTMPWQKPTPVLLVNGEPAEQVAATDVVTQALAQAVAATGLQINVTKAGEGR
jgi:hypothetical protein